MDALAKVSSRIKLFFFSTYQILRAAGDLPVFYPFCFHPSIRFFNYALQIRDFNTQAHRMYKIKTEGDAYVCCAGCPAASPHHAVQAADFALDVSLAMPRLREVRAT